MQPPPPPREHTIKESMSPWLMVKLGIAIFLLLTSAVMSLMVAYRKEPAVIKMPPRPHRPHRPIGFPKANHPPQAPAPSPTPARVVDPAARRLKQDRDEKRTDDPNKFWKAGKASPRVVIKSHDNPKRRKRYAQLHPLMGAKYMQRKYFQDQKKVKVKRCWKKFPVRRYVRKYPQKVLKRNMKIVKERAYLAQLLSKMFKVDEKEKETTTTTKNFTIIVPYKIQWKDFIKFADHHNITLNAIMDQWLLHVKNEAKNVNSKKAINIAIKNDVEIKRLKKYLAMISKDSKQTMYEAVRNEPSNFFKKMSNILKIIINVFSGDSTKSDLKANGNHSNSFNKSNSPDFEENKKEEIRISFIHKMRKNFNLPFASKNDTANNLLNDFNNNKNIKNNQTLILNKETNTNCSHFAKLLSNMFENFQKKIENAFGAAKKNASTTKTIDNIITKTSEGRFGKLLGKSHNILNSGEWLYILH